MNISGNAFSFIFRLFGETQEGLALCYCWKDWIWALELKRKIIVLVNWSSGDVQTSLQRFFALSSGILSKI